MKSLRVRRLTFRETIEIYDTDDDQVLNNGSDEDGRGYMDMYNAALLAACRVVRGERAHEQSHGPWLIIGPGIARFPDAALGTRNGAARGSPRPPKPNLNPPDVSRSHRRLGPSQFGKTRTSAENRLCTAMSSCGTARVPVTTRRQDVEGDHKPQGGAEENRPTHHSLRHGSKKYALPCRSFFVRVAAIVIWSRLLLRARHRERVC
jgi:hypothetical protein